MRALLGKRGNWPRCFWNPWWIAVDHGGFTVDREEWIVIPHHSSTCMTCAQFLNVFDVVFQWLRLVESCFSAMLPSLKRPITRKHALCLPYGNGLRGSLRVKTMMSFGTYQIPQKRPRTRMYTATKTDCIWNYHKRHINDKSLEYVRNKSTQLCVTMFKTSSDSRRLPHKCCNMSQGPFS
jgi:hypothetical protein